MSVAILDDIEQVLEQVYIDSKDLKQLQLEQSIIKVKLNVSIQCTVLVQLFEGVLSVVEPGVFGVLKITFVRMLVYLCVFVCLQGY